MYRLSLILFLTGFSFILARDYKNPVLKLTSSSNRYIYPTVTEKDGVYYMIVENFSFDLYFSVDLQTWTKEGTILEKPNPDYQDLEIWSPRMFVSKNNDIRLFYSRYNVSSSRISPHGYTLGVAYAADVAGPYLPNFWPLTTTDSDYLSDPFVFEDDEKTYLYYATSYDGIHVVPLENKYLTISNKKPVVVLKDTEKWEAMVVNSPYVVKRNGLYYLFYFGGSFCVSTSGISVARAISPLGPFEKSKKILPVTRADGSGLAMAPNVVRDASGEDVLVYQFAELDCSSPGVYARALKWVDGWPSVELGDQ